VEHEAELAHAVGDSRRGAGVVRIRVDRHRRRREVDAARLGRSAPRVEAAGGDDDESGLLCADCLPGGRIGRLSCSTEDVFTARGRNHLWKPVSSREGRIHPLRDEDPASWTACDRPADGLDRGAHPICNRDPALLHAEALSQHLDGGRNLLQRRGI